MSIAATCPDCRSYTCICTPLITAVPLDSLREVHAMKLRYSDKVLALELMRTYFEAKGMKVWVDILEEVKEDIYRLEDLEQ